MVHIFTGIVILQGCWLLPDIVVGTPVITFLTKPLAFNHKSLRKAVNERICDILWKTGEKVQTYWKEILHDVKESESFHLCCYSSINASAFLASTYQHVLPTRVHKPSWGSRALQNPFRLNPIGADGNPYQTHVHWLQEVCFGWYQTGAK